MKVKLYNIDKKEVGDIALDKSVFSEPKNDAVLKQVLNWQLAKRRAGTQNVKSRSEVVGTTKKPFRQKGTGNARQGSLKGPHQRGGGVANAFSPRDYGYTLNKKIRVKGLKVALSAKLEEGTLFIVDTAEVKTHKTSDLKKRLDKAGLNNSLFVRGSSDNDNFSKAVSNIKGSNAINQIGVNVYDIIRHENVVITKHALEELQKRLVK
jgi:large subunit ribosomal protein L4